jgi:MarR family transcriptional regulator, organic hydroperoxide resistance regulator
MFELDVRAIQAAYPKIYLACHERHQRAASNAHRISERHASILAHLDREQPMSVSVLARHLALAPSSLSATLDTLERLGYLERERESTDRRRVRVRLCERGEAAMQGASVLDTRRLEHVLAQLSASERTQARVGLELLARAASASLAGTKRASTRKKGPK